MTASGIPPHITQFYEYGIFKTSLKDAIVEHQTEQNSKISSVLDRMQLLEERFSLLPQLVSDEIKQNFTIKGVAQVTSRDVESMLESKVSRLESSIADKLNEFMNRYLSNGVSLGTSSDLPAVIDVQVVSTSNIPDSYRLPSLDVRNMWSVWFRGSVFKDVEHNVTYAIKPLYKCSAADLKQKKDKDSLSKMRQVIKFLVPLDETHDQLANLDSGLLFYGTLDRLCREKFGVGQINTSSKVIDNNI